MEVSLGKHRIRVEILALIVLVFFIMFGHLLCGCSKVGIVEGMDMLNTFANGNPLKKARAVNVYNNNNNTTEGFVGSNNSATGPEFAGAKTPDYIMNPSTWSMPSLTYSPGAKPSAGVKSIWNRSKQPIPLPKDELDMFATTDFKPECCPNAYSNGSGCACMTVDQYNYLRERGSNNVPYSEY